MCASVSMCVCVCVYMLECASVCVFVCIMYVCLLLVPPHAPQSLSDKYMYVIIIMWLRSQAFLSFLMFAR